MRLHVPFEALWSMPIEVPYSLMLRAGGYAWSCGQLALDSDSSVMAADDLGAQCRIVRDYVDEILTRGDLPASSVQRMLLYHVDRGIGERDRMLHIFRQRFGDAVLLDPIPVPHFYYDGVLLEVDVFCRMGGSRTDSTSRAGAALKLVDSGEFVWASLETSADSLGAATQLLEENVQQLGIARADVLSEHWFAPNRLLSEAAARFSKSGHEMDAGALVDVGRGTDSIRGIFTFVRGASLSGGSERHDTEDLRILSRRGGAFTWVHARSLNRNLDLVDQTKQIMGGIERVFDRLGVTFAEVVKSTAHYTGGSSPEELHDNMRVRNGYYSKPGPASTGSPVYGFSDPASRIVVDVTTMRDPESSG